MKPFHGATRRLATALMVFAVLPLAVVAPARAQSASPTTHPPSAAGRHMLWRVTGPRGTVYLLGSVHLLSPDAYPLPSVIDTAFAHASRLVFEANIDSLQMRGAELVARGTLPAGQTLQGVLPAATYATLDSLAPAYHLPLIQVQRFKPWVISLMLSQLALASEGFSPQYGVDVQLDSRAKAAGKAIGGLESVDFQLDLFDSLSPAEQLDLLKESLISPDSARREMLSLKTDWMTGDDAALARDTELGFADDSALYNRLLANRTRGWVPQVEAMLQAPQTVLVVVGAGHLVGRNGLVALLRAKGYTVSQL